jgi:Flp pilus assembly protein TadG
LSTFRKLNATSRISQIGEVNPMRISTMCVSFARRALNDQRGQTLPFVALGMVAFVGVAGLSIDVGRAYVVRSQLQSSANAAALAALPNLYNSNTTTTVTSNAVTNAADALSASSGGAN